MNSNDNYSRHTYSYLALRKAVGWIGILLPFTLMFGGFFIFKEEIVQNSISHYYYTGMRNVFVGALCAVALFMFFYSGYNKWDNRAGNVAGIFAIGVAWFPTSEFGSTDFTGIIHFVCASIFFLTLAVFSIFLFTKTGNEKKPTKEKLKRNKIYITCGILMFVCLITIPIYQNFIFDVNSSLRFVFWAETIALISFGISWLTKGGTLYPDKN